MRKAMILAAGLLFAGTLTACGNDDASTPSVATGQGSGASAPASASFDGAKFTKCMRDNGMDWFPEMTSPDQQVTAPDGVDKAKMQAALDACRAYAPAGTTSGPQKGGPDRATGLQYSKCMRDNGVANFPDPSADGSFPKADVDRNSPTFKAARAKCDTLLPKPDGE